ncbi:MAG TPA: hypothetical protein VF533_18580 [Solirubrobacteraceae bacterium]|jgi:hypothetical protein
MAVRRVLRWSVVSIAVLLATFSVVATLQAQEGSTGLASPTAAVPLSDGGLLVTDFEQCVVKRVTSGGTATVVAGVAGTCQNSGDGGPATAAGLNRPTDAVPTADGGYLIATFSIVDCRIRRVDAAGIITTVAGKDGICEDTGDGGKATDASILSWSVVPYNAPGAAVNAPGGGFLIASGCSVRRVDAAGTITRVAGNGICSNQEPGVGTLACRPGFCAMGSIEGFLSTTTDPTADPLLLRNTLADPGRNVLMDLSCPTTTFCAGVNFHGISASKNLGAESPTWSQAGPSAWSISCPSAALCVAGLDSGRIATSTNPGAAAPDYTQTQVFGSDDELRGLDCLSASFCAGATFRGEAAITRDPLGGADGWTRKSISPDTGLSDISCASESLCVISGGTEGLYVSTNPTDADPTWTGQAIGKFVWNVDCPTTTLCVGIDHEGNTYTSKNPAAADPTWTVRQINGGASLGDVSCPSASRCFITAGSRFLSSADPGAADPTWKSVTAYNDGVDGLPATSEPLHTATNATPTADGGFLVTELGDTGTSTPGKGSRVRKVSAEGIITTVAGTGEPGYTGDGGPATAARLNNPVSSVPTADGGILISEYTNCTVRKVDAAGTITTVAGVGPSAGPVYHCDGTAGSGGAATETALLPPTSAIPDPANNFVIGTARQQDGSPTPNDTPLNRVLPDGRIVTALAPAPSPTPTPTPTPDPGGGGGGGGGGTPGPGATPPPGGGGGGGGTPTVPAPVCTLKAASTKVLVRKKKRSRAKPGVLKLKVACDRDATLALTGKAVAKPRKKGAKKKTASLRRVTGTVKGGVAVTLKAKLPASTRKLLAKRAKVSVSFALTATGAGGTGTATTRIAKLKAKR